MNEYIDTLSDEDRKTICFQPSKKSFTFGNGRMAKSLRKLTIPIYMWNGKRGSITTDIVEFNIPLLLSLNVMRQAEMIINCKRDIVTKDDGKNNDVIELKLISTGHYAVPMAL